MAYSIKDSFEKFRKLKKEVSEKSPHEKYIFVRNFITFYYNWIGCPITDPSYKPSWKAWLYFVSFLDITLVELCTQYHYRDDMFRCMQGLYSYGVVIPVGTFISLIMRACMFNLIAGK